MRFFHLVGVGLYVAYLVHVGLLMLVLPWSSLWPTLLVRMPYQAALALDQPAVRGAVAAFGALHLLLVAAEVVAAARNPPR